MTKIISRSANNQARLIKQALTARDVRRVLHLLSQCERVEDFKLKEDDALNSKEILLLHAIQLAWRDRTKKDESKKTIARALRHFHTINNLEWRRWQQSSFSDLRTIQVLGGHRLSKEQKTDITKMMLSALDDEAYKKVASYVDPDSSAATREKIVKVFSAITGLALGATSGICLGNLLFAITPWLIPVAIIVGLYVFAHFSLGQYYLSNKNARNRVLQQGFFTAIDEQTGKRREFVHGRKKSFMIGLLLITGATMAALVYKSLTTILIALGASGTFLSLPVLLLVLPICAVVGLTFFASSLNLIVSFLNGKDNLWLWTKKYFSEITAKMFPGKAVLEQRGCSAAKRNGIYLLRAIIFLLLALAAIAVFVGLAYGLGITALGLMTWMMPTYVTLGPILAGLLAAVVFVVKSADFLSMTSKIIARFVDWYTDGMQKFSVSGCGKAIWSTIGVVMKSLLLPYPLSTVVNSYQLRKLRGKDPQLVRALETDGIDPLKAVIDKNKKGRKFESSSRSSSESDMGNIIPLAGRGMSKDFAGEVKAEDMVALHHDSLALQIPMIIMSSISYSADPASRYVGSTQQAEIDARAKRLERLYANFEATPESRANANASRRRVKNQRKKIRSGSNQMRFFPFPKVRPTVPFSPELK